MPDVGGSADVQPSGPRDPPGSYAELARRTLLVVGIAALVVVVLLLIGYAAQVLLLFFAAVLFAIFLSGPSNWLARHTRLPRGGALAIVVVVLLILAGLTGWLFADRISQQVTRLGELLPQAIAQAREFLAGNRWTQPLPTSPEDLAQSLGSQETWSKVRSFIATSLGLVTDVLVIFFVGLFLAVAPRRYTEGIVLLVPPAGRGRAREVLQAQGHTLGWWLVGRWITMVEVGVLTGLGLWLLGVPLALTLGLLTGLANFVPNIGPIVAAVPPVLIALTVSPMTAVYVLLLYTAVGMFDGYVVTPLVQQQTVSLPAALIIGSQVLFGYLVGGIGVLLATPLTAALVVLVKRLYVRDALA